MVASKTRLPWPSSSLTLSCWCTPWTSLLGCICTVGRDNALESRQKQTSRWRRSTRSRYSWRMGPFSGPGRYLSRGAAPRELHRYAKVWLLTGPLAQSANDRICLHCWPKRMGKWSSQRQGLLVLEEALAEVRKGWRCCEAE